MCDLRKVTNQSSKAKFRRKRFTYAFLRTWNGWPPTSWGIHAPNLCLFRLMPMSSYCSSMAQEFLSAHGPLAVSSLQSVPEGARRSLSPGDQTAICHWSQSRRFWVCGNNLLPCRRRQLKGPSRHIYPTLHRLRCCFLNSQSRSKKPKLHGFKDRFSAIFAAESKVYLGPCRPLCWTCVHFRRKVSEEFSNIWHGAELCGGKTFPPTKYYRCGLHESTSSFHDNLQYLDLIGLLFERKNLLRCGICSVDFEWKVNTKKNTRNRFNEKIKSKIKLKVWLHHHMAFMTWPIYLAQFPRQDNTQAIVFTMNAKFALA